MSTPQRASPGYLGTHPAPCNLAVLCLLLRIWLVVLLVTDSTCCYFISLFFQSVFSSVQLLSHVQLFATSWTAARQASLSNTNSRSLLKLKPIESVMPSNQSTDHLTSPMDMMPSCPLSWWCHPTSLSSLGLGDAIQPSLSSLGCKFHGEGTCLSGSLLGTQDFTQELGTQ